MRLVLVLLVTVHLESGAFDPADRRNVVIFPCGHESDAYWVHIAAAVLAIDAMGEWAVWMTDAQKSLDRRPQRSKYDQDRLRQLNRPETVLTHKLVLQRSRLTHRERAMVVILHYGWANFDFGLGFQYLEQVPEPIRHVYVTVFEADGPSLAMMLQARRMDEVWTTCHNNAVDFQAALGAIGTEGPPVYDIPLAMPLMNYSGSWVDPYESRQASKPSFLPGLSVDAAAVFLFMKRASYDSGLDLLLRAFLREFPAEPRAPQLILKLIMGDIHWNAMLAHVLESCPECPRELPSNVLVITDRLDSEELEALYNVSDFSIEPTRTLGCMSVADMHMMQRGRPHIGPAVNFCQSCRVHGSSNGTSGVFAVEVTDVVPAFSEYWLTKILYADFLDSGGELLPPPPPLYASWSSFVMDHRNPVSSNAAALKTQSMRGRITGPILSEASDNRAEWLARFLTMGCWDAARQAAMALYVRLQRVPEAMVGLAVAWLNLGLLTPALISVEMAWELLRRPLLKDGHTTHAPPRVPESWSEQLAQVTTDLHCAVVKRLPQTTWHYEYMRMWPMNLTRCGIRLAPTDANSRAKAHYDFLWSFSNGLLQHDLVYSESVGRPAVGLDGARGVLHDSLAAKEDLKRTITTHWGFSFMTDPNFGGVSELHMDIMENISVSRATMLRRESQRAECNVLSPVLPSDYEARSFKWEGTSTLIEVLRKCLACLNSVCSESSPCRR